MTSLSPVPAEPGTPGEALRDLAHRMHYRADDGDSPSDCAAMAEFAAELNRWADELDAALAPPHEAAPMPVLRAYAVINFVTAHRDQLEAEVKQLRGKVADLKWAEILTEQGCAEGRHTEWYADTENLHTCPWCEIERQRAELAAARSAAPGPAPTTTDGLVVAWRLVADLAAEVDQEARDRLVTIVADAVLDADPAADVYAGRPSPWPPTDHRPLSSVPPGTEASQ